MATGLQLHIYKKEPDRASIK